MRKISYVLLAFVMLCMQSNLQAQSLTATSTGTPSAITSPTSAAQTCPGEETMVDQSADITTSGVISAEFSSNPGFDAIVADDFTVTDDVVLAGAQFMGFASSGGSAPHPSVDIIVFSDDNGKPGTEVYKENYTADAAGNAIGDEFMVYIPTEVKLTAGKYWIAAQIKGTDRWNWFQNSTSQSSNPHIINPGGGFGIGTDWTDFTSIGLTSGGMNFVLDFCPAPVPPVAGDPIPTMSEWGLMIFGLLMINLGVFFVRRRESILA